MKFVYFVTSLFVLITNTGFGYDEAPLRELTALRGMTVSTSACKLETRLNPARPRSIVTTTVGRLLKDYYSYYDLCDGLAKAKEKTATFTLFVDGELVVGFYGIPDAVEYAVSPAYFSRSWLMYKANQ